MLATIKMENTTVKMESAASTDIIIKEELQIIDCDEPCTESSHFLPLPSRPDDDHVDADQSWVHSESDGNARVETEAADISTEDAANFCYAVIGEPVKLELVATGGDDVDRQQPGVTQFADTNSLQQLDDGLPGPSKRARFRGPVCPKVFRPESSGPDRNAYPNVCSMCGQAFKMAKTLSNHLAMAACPKCTTVFHSQCALHRHIRDGCPRDLQCATCSKTFAERAALVAHSKLHPKKKKHRCKGCATAFSAKRDLEKHVANDCKRHLQCATCYRMFSSELGVKVHLQHGCPRDFGCKRCRRVFAWKRKLEVHNRSSTCARGLECPRCWQDFVSVWSLGSHVKSVDCARRLRCRTCGEWFAWMQELAAHLKGGNCQRGRRCPSCPNVYPTMRELDVHIMDARKSGRMACQKCSRLICRHHLVEHVSHECGLHLECKRCGKVFAWKSHLDSHLGACERRKEYEPVAQCLVCGRMFRDTGELKAHKCPKQTCRKCNKTYVNETKLAAHREKCGPLEHWLFRCFKCGKPFRCGRELNKHVCRAEAASRYFRCGKCDAVFESESYLDAHVDNCG